MAIQQMMLGIGAAAGGPGQEVLSVGSGNWTVPAGVTSISIVAVGGGAAGMLMSGGGGGALAVRNNVSVTPGDTCAYTVGAGGDLDVISTANIIGKNTTMTFNAGTASEVVITANGASENSGQTGGTFNSGSGHGTDGGSGGNSGTANNLRTAGAGGQFANFRQAAYNFTQIQSSAAMNQGSNGGGDFSYKSTDIAYGDSGGFNDSGKKGIFWVWKHAPGFFDSVAYFGNGGNAQTIKHNLGKVPEMIWFRRMNSSGHWAVYHPSIPDPLDYYLRLDSGQTAQADSNFVSSTPTATSVTLGNSSLNNSGTNFYMAMFFGSVDGVSKVGSYAGNGGSQNIDCGFANGSAYVLIKNISAAEHWICFDNVRGIVSGNDPAVYYSLDYAQQTGTDYIDPNNSGFNVASGNNYVNASGDNYIFYAIAA